MTRLSPRERTLLGWGGVALALYLLLDLAVLPYWDAWGETRSAAEIQARRVRNFRRILERQGRIEAELETLRRRTESLEQGLLDSSGDALAGAEIQGLVKDIAAAHGMTIQNSDLAPIEKISPQYSKVSTRVGLQAGIHQFVDFMAAMGSDPKILFVENLRIAPVRAGGRRDRNRNKDIRMTLVISALKRAEPEKAEEPPVPAEAAGAARRGERP